MLSSTQHAVRCFASRLLVISRKMGSLFSRLHTSSAKSLGKILYCLSSPGRLCPSFFSPPGQEICTKLVKFHDSEEYSRVDRGFLCTFQSAPPVSYFFPRRDKEMNDSRNLRTPFIRCFLSPRSYRPYWVSDLRSLPLPPHAVVRRIWRNSSHSLRTQPFNLL